MNCPIDRGGCGKQLKWHEGAFCDECMKQPKEQMEEVMNKNREFEELVGMECPICKGKIVLCLDGWITRKLAYCSSCGIAIAVKKTDHTIKTDEFLKEKEK